MKEDEGYVIGLCDDVLQLRAQRGHRFDFLLGDLSSKTGEQVRLPVDAFYAELKLVVEYHERQHTEGVALFDRRLTPSGTRGEQRPIYDARRRDVLPLHGIRCVEIRHTDFANDSRKRIVRSERDIEIVRNILLQPGLNHALIEARVRTALPPAKVPTKG